MTKQLLILIYSITQYAVSCYYLQEHVATCWSSRYIAANQQVHVSLLGSQMWPH